MTMRAINYRCPCCGLEHLYDDVTAEWCESLFADLAEARERFGQDEPITTVDELKQQTRYAALWAAGLEGQPQAAALRVHALEDVYFIVIQDQLIAACDCCFLGDEQGQLDRTVEPALLRRIAAWVRQCVRRIERIRSLADCEDHMN